MPRRMHHPRPRRRIGGFALIEQIAAILAIGAASAVALPRLATLQADAQGLALQQPASTAMLLNQGGCLVTGQRTEPGRCRPVRDCADVGTLLHDGLPGGYTAPAHPLPRGAEGPCRLVQSDSGQSAAFTGLGAGD